MSEVEGVGILLHKRSGRYLEAAFQILAFECADSIFNDRKPLVDHWQAFDPQFHGGRPAMEGGKESGLDGLDPLQNPLFHCL